MAPRTRLLVNVSVPDGAAPAARGLGPWLSRTAPASTRGELTIAVVSDRRMRSLNRIFRGVDATTDVLSFPTDHPLPPGRAPALLGDVVIAAGRARQQAAAHGHALSTEFKVLALHGLLHLLGHDHETDGGRMAQVEARLRRKGGLPAGLIARAGRTRR